jgi:hypothetical protein
MLMWARRVTGFLLIVAIGGCSGRAGPTGVDVLRPGTYAGTMEDLQSIGGKGIATLAFVSTGDVATGSWLVDFSDGAYRNVGQFSGTAARGHVDLTLRPANSRDCVFVVRALTAPDDRISGTYRATVCSLPFAGPIELRLQ